MGAVAAGLVIATALKLLPSLRSNPMGWPASAALGAAVLIAVLHLHWHLPLILLGVGTIACALAWCRVGATATPPDKAAQ
jgi:chromate transporter